MQSEGQRQDEDAMTALPTSARTENAGWESRKRPEVELFNPFEKLFRPDRRPEPFDGFDARKRAKEAL